MFQTLLAQNLLSACLSFSLQASRSSRPSHLHGVTKVIELSITWPPSTCPRTPLPFCAGQELLSEIEYLGPEPDRWRSPAEPELVAVQAPEHFIDLELADPLGPLPHRRFDFEASVFASGQRPEKIGLQPWQANEVWERLKAALREYRRLSDAHQDTHDVEQVAIFYAGWLGHYVGDASQPLHTTVQYNGWTGPNPNGYTTEHKIHWKFEGPFVGANLHDSDVQPRIAPVRALEGDVFDDYVAYLRQSSKFVEKVYQLEKAGGFDGAGSRNRANSPLIALLPAPACSAT